MKLIDKAAVVAEIENLLDKGKYHEEYDCAYRDGNNGALYALKSKLDTLETKEVDLENAVKGRIDYPLIGADFPNIYPNYRELKDYCDKNGIKDEDKVKIIITKTL